MNRWSLFLPLIVLLLTSSVALADPCGMVPPIYPGEDILITRVGEQRTYVFYKDGIETFAIRAGFSGKVDEFGMLIPFPTPPAIRKVPDNIFEQIQAAIDPPEVVVDLRPQPQRLFLNNFAKSAAVPDDASASLKFHEVRVLKQEAIGMYEVTTLEAGSPAALKRWMDDHGYMYPKDVGNGDIGNGGVGNGGMDKVCQEFIDLGWCFVCVKTQIAQKKGVDPQPGQREVNPKLPAGATFDGSVQAMGFRFKSKEFTVPMRLSAFNAGRTHNQVYLLTDGPRQVDSMSQALVRRQVPGHVLFHNVTQPLPLRIIGGTEADIPDYRKQTLPKERDPTPHNGLAKELFASDLLAVSSGQLALPHEEKEKELLRIGERLSLRGPEIDKLNNDALTADREKTVKAALEGIKSLTMTVVDGDFPRDVLAKDNLRFVSFQMPAELNAATSYDVRLKGPAQKQEGQLIGAAPSAPPKETGAKSATNPKSGDMGNVEKPQPGKANGAGEGGGGSQTIWWTISGIAVAALIVLGLFALRGR